MAEHEFAGLRCSDVLDLSGSFVLGALSPDEVEAVRAHLAACPELHAEVAELGSVLPALFETVELVDPPAGLRDRILAAAAADTQRSAAAEAQASEVPRPAVALPAAPAARRGFDFGAIFRRPVWAAAAMAAVVAAVALGAWNVQLRNEVDALAAYQRDVAAVLDSAGRPDALVAVLTPPEGGSGPSGLAAVNADGNVALVMRDLAPTAGTQVYETWLIGSDSTPVPVGSFTVGPGGIASFVTQHALPGGGVTVALTLEDAPGATTPKLPIVVLGTGQAQAG